MPKDRTIPQTQILLRRLPRDLVEAMAQRAEQEQRTIKATWERAAELYLSQKKEKGISPPRVKRLI